MDSVKVHMLVVWVLLNVINTGNVRMYSFVDLNVIDTGNVRMYSFVDLNVIDTDKGTSI